MAGHSCRNKLLEIQVKLLLDRYSNHTQSAAAQAEGVAVTSGFFAEANKRIGNILKKAGIDGGDPVDKSLIKEPAETALFESVVKAQKAVAPLLNDRDYTNVLTTLADLRDPIDGFFDDVMVMTDDEALRNNRLALLAELRAMFLNVADVSRLSIG